MSRQLGDVFWLSDRDERGGSCNPYVELCPDCHASDSDEFCRTCNDTGYKPVLVAEHDRWWVRLLKRMLRRK